ncbi:MAG: hypothetical protein AAF682_25145 [Planctomycetota bacterium]
MKFRFRLERLKRVRAIEERVARAAWAEAERRARDAEDGVDAIRDGVDRARGAAPGSVGDAISPRRAELDLQAIDRMLGELLRRKELSLTLRGQASQLAAARREREVDRRALEELEQRHRERFRREANRRESLALDEIALQRKGRRESDSSRRERTADEEGAG